MLKNEDRKPYNDMAKTDRDRYDREMELWKKGEFARNDEADEVEYSEEED